MEFGGNWSLEIRELEVLVAFGGNWSLENIEILVEIGVWRLKNVEILVAFSGNLNVDIWSLENLHGIWRFLPPLGCRSYREWGISFSWRNDHPIVVFVGFWDSLQTPIR